MNVVEEMRNLIGIIDDWLFDPIFEMANLCKQHTGIDGLIFISSRMASHGPRLKFYPTGNPSGPTLIMTIANHPTIKVVTGMRRVLAQSYAKELSKWILLNKDELECFWREGKLWSPEEIYEFTKSLKKI